MRGQLSSESKDCPPLIAQRLASLEAEVMKLKEIKEKYLAAQEEAKDAEQKKRPNGKRIEGQNYYLFDRSVMAACLFHFSLSQKPEQVLIKSPDFLPNSA